MKYLRSFLVILIGLFVIGQRRAARGEGGLRRLHHDGSGTSPGGKAGRYVDPDGDVDSPADLTATGWKAALLRTKQALKDKNLTMSAAALAYYTTLAFFPAALGLATFYTAIAGPEGLLALLRNMELVVPPVVQNLLETQLTPLSRAQQTSLGIASLVSLGLVFWTTSGGIQNLVKALNVAYDVRESRGLIKLRLVSLALSVVFILFILLALVLLVLQGDALHAIGLPTTLANIFPILRWPLLVVVLSIFLAVIYRYAPDRKEPKWSWVSWGAAAATIIWLIGTALFFIYAQNFGNFNRSYGTFASIIILMTWFNLSSLIILVGGQVNKKLEDVTEADTAAR
ncbi:MAG TPA: YihY/virulence factor BrkB family protein [Candidatus Saccharimonadales bacterium]|nr:YihY/virulence factor BrkB family protein [Candidatus Saccharimonadales bacterium]